jgi:hypothetical protein
MKLHNRKPDINNLYKVLQNKEPDRPALFELFMNIPFYEQVTGRRRPARNAPEIEWLKLQVDAFAACGFDYTTCQGSAAPGAAAAAPDPLVPIPGNFTPQLGCSVLELGCSGKPAGCPGAYAGYILLAASKEE